MGIFNKQSKTMVIQTSEYSPYGSDSFSAPRTGDSGISGFSSFSNVAEYERRDQIYKTNIRLLRFVTRCISLALSGYMVGSMSYTLLVYLQTRNHTSADSPSTLVWGSPKTLWPTYLILALSSLTAIMNIVTISAYLCSIAAANKSGDFTVFAGYVMLGIEIIVWSVASGLYKYSDRGDDLWGFSCGKSSESVIEKVESFVNWGKLCQTQNVTWIACIVQVGLHILTVITFVLVLRRMRGKKEMELLGKAAMYGNAAPTETKYWPGMRRKYMPVAKSASNT